MSGLQGKRIVVTRAPHQAEELAKLLTDAGAGTLRYPCIDIAPPIDVNALNDAIGHAHAGKFDWIVVTSSNTVRALATSGLNASRTGARWAVVGPSTAAALLELMNVRAAFTPTAYHAAALASELPIERGARILLPQSDAADDAVAERLAARGASVTSAIAYRTVTGSGGVDLPALLRAGQVDAITLTSGTTLLNLIRRLDAEGGDRSLLWGVPLACIGSETAAVVRQNGLVPTIVPPAHTIPSLVSAIVFYFEAPHVR